MLSRTTLQSRLKALLTSKETKKMFSIITELIVKKLIGYIINGTLIERCERILVSLQPYGIEIKKITHILWIYIQ